MFGDPDYDPVGEGVVNTTLNPTPHLEYTLKINRPVNTFFALQPSTSAYITQSAALSSATPQIDSFSTLLSDYIQFPHNISFNLDPNPLVY
jgi:hypothetical protein